MRKLIKNISIIGIIGISFLGCSGIGNLQTPDYNALKSQSKKTNISNLKFNTNSKYNSIYSQMIRFDIEDHRPTIINNYSTGILDIKGKKITFNTKVPIFDKHVKLKFNIDECASLKNGTQQVDILNEDGSIDDLLTSKVNSNEKTIKELKDMSKIIKDVIFCKNWSSGETKDLVNKMDSMINLNLNNENLFLNPDSFPTTYEGIVDYNGQKYYLFTVKNGKVFFSGTDIKDKAGSLMVNMKMLININTKITERLNSSMVGNVIFKGYNVNLNITEMYNANIIKEKIK